MKTAKAVITGASFTLVAWVCAAGCSSKTTPNGSGDSFGDDSSSSSGGTSSSNGSTSGSSGGSSSGGSSTMPTAAYADGGIACGTGTGCPQSDECCFAPAMVSTEAGLPGFGGLGGFGGAATGPTCTAAGSCSGSSLSCSNPSQCSTGQTCCFAYQQSEAGAAPGGGFGGLGAFGGGGGGMTFGAQCADSCPTGDMVHYQLCASSTDCPSGQTCTMGLYTLYCVTMGGGGGFPGTPGGPTNPTGDDGGSVDDGGSD